MNYTAEFRAKVIHEIQPDITQDELVDRYGISQSIPATNIEDINAAAAKKNKNFLKKERKSVKISKIV